MEPIKVKKSAIHGRGVFLTKSVKKNHSVSRLRGRIRTKENLSLEDSLANPDWVGISKNRWIDPIPPYKYINHSCDPSTGIKGTVTLVALRNLKSGDEITIDYSAVEADPRWYMKCSCKAKGCRKVIRSIQFLPQENFKRYLPFVSTYFKKLRAAPV